MSNIKLCRNCRNKNNQDIFYSGYYSWLDNDCYQCPMKNCGHELVNINLSKEEFNVIISISKNIIFLESMIDLKEKDPIEYQLKMSQFKSQVEQQQSNKLQNDNTPKCPTCNSTNIKKISGLSKAGSVAMWGLLSRKVHKQWHCNQCGSEW